MKVFLSPHQHERQRRSGRDAHIIRDFDRKHFEARKRKMMEIAKKVGKGLHPDCYIELVIEEVITTCMSR